MRNFLLKILLSILPLLIIIAIPIVILYRSKEIYFNIDKVVSSKNKYLIGYAYNDLNSGYLKWSYLNLHEKKDVWVLGSSTVLQFRSQMFKTSFYNGGYAISSIYDFRQFLKSIPKKKYPKYLLVGLSHMFFNEFSEGSNSTRLINSWKNDFSSDLTKSNYLQVYKDLFAGKIRFEANQNEILKIGLNANINNVGYRNDGSIFYGDQICKLISGDSTANDYHFRNTLDRIKKGNKRFEYCSSVNQNALSELTILLDFCKQHDIYVVAYLPPFADKVYNTMRLSKKYNYLDDLYVYIKPIFNKYNYEFYDFSKVSYCNSNDNETIDGFHSGEVTHQKMLISMLNANSAINKVCNIDLLKKDLLNRKNNYIVYDY